MPKTGPSLGKVVHSVTLYIPFCSVYCQASLGQQIPAAHRFASVESNTAHAVVLLQPDHVQGFLSICHRDVSKKAASYPP